MTSAHIKLAIEKDLAKSFWLKKAINELDNRDICDALKDSQILQHFLETKARESGL